MLPSRSEASWEALSKPNPLFPTVVLVSGFAATRRNLSVIRKRLIRDGFNVVILSLDWQSLADGLIGLEPLVRRLSSTILQLRKDPGMQRSKIHLVAHSAGGLVARRYIQVLGGWHYCDSLITLATPHRGTWIAGLGLFTHLFLKARCLWQMLPWSPFIKSLNDSPMPPGFRFTSIVSTDDYLCPPSATRLPTDWLKEPEIQCVSLVGLSHGDFLLSKDAYAELLKALSSELAAKTITTPEILSQAVEAP